MVSERDKICLLETLERVHSLLVSPVSSRQGHLEVTNAAYSHQSRMAFVCWPPGVGVRLPRRDGDVGDQIYGLPFRLVHCFRASPVIAMQPGRAANKPGITTIDESDHLGTLPTQFFGSTQEIRTRRGGRWHICREKE